MVGTANGMLLVLVSLATIAHGLDSVVRREPQSVHLSADGDLKRGRDTQDKARDEPAALAADEELSDLAICNIDFIRGPVNSTNCSDTTQHALILEESLCRQAAEYSNAMAGVHAGPNSSMILPVNYEYFKPRGCFKEACTESPTGVCYVLNEIGDWPSHPEGEAICSRPKNLNGTQDSNWGCPTGYGVIDDPETCESVANCLSKTAGEPFIIGTYNASRHLDYPRGCFIDSEDDKVYYNSASPLGEGLNVRGTPICNVTNVVRWGSDGSLLNVSY